MHKITDPDSETDDDDAATSRSSSRARTTVSTNRFAHNIACWHHRCTPPPEERDDRLADFPYLSPGLPLLPREPGETDWMRDVCMFNIASTMSFGPSGGSINAMTTAVPKLVAGVTRGLCIADVEKHRQSLRSYDVPQSILRERRA